MKKILVIEDEPAYLKLLRDQLTKAGYEVIEANNGEEGLTAALKQKPDLILLDLIMPKMGGLKMLNTIRKFKWGEGVPVFILSNVYGSEEISAALHDRASKYFVKSELSLDDLLANIKTILQGR